MPNLVGTVPGVSKLAVVAFKPIHDSRAENIDFEICLNKQGDIDCIRPTPVRLYNKKEFSCCDKVSGVFFYVLNKLV